MRGVIRTLAFLIALVAITAFASAQNSVSGSEVTVIRAALLIDGEANQAKKNQGLVAVSGEPLTDIKAM